MRKILLTAAVFSNLLVYSLQQNNHEHYRQIDKHGKRKDQWNSDKKQMHEEERRAVTELPVEEEKLPLEASGSATFFSHGETRDFLQFLKRIHYDHRQFPENRRGEAVLVEVSVVVSNIRSVSEVTMDYALELFYRESWTDIRLRYDKKDFNNKTELFLHESYTNFLWFPDTFVPNALASKNPQRHSISHRSLLRLSDKGTILYSRRISLICECTMDLTLFPFDKQVCKLGLESYGYTADQVIYKWSNGTREAIRLATIRLPDFTISSVYVTRVMEEYATGNYSRLYACFVFSRSSGFCFLQLIIPSTAVVITSWVSLWMETETEFQDMISIILAITFLIFSYNEMMPRVSYIKAMDIYLGVCFMIVFLSLIKLALVKYMRQKLAVNSFTSTHNNQYSNSMPPLHLPDLSQVSTRRRNKILRQTGLRAISTSRYKYQPTLLDDDIPDEKNKKPRQLTRKLAGLLDWHVTPAAVHRFHWISQMLFFFGFVTFCIFYFAVFPNLQVSQIDPACDLQKAEQFAPID